MPVHDWTRVTAGIFHHFHQGWITELSRSLNGLLPDDYYAMAEQRAGTKVPDVLTLESVRGPLAEQGHELPGPELGPPEESEDSAEHGARDAGGGVALAEAPPKVGFTDVVSEAALLTLKQRRVAIRHATNDRIVALLEIVSPGNKDARGPVDAFVDKALAAIQKGYHLMVLDVLPPTPSMQVTLHDRIWRGLNGAGYHLPDKPLTLSADRVARDVTTYVESIAIGAVLPDMPLFFTPERYVNVPLETTYRAAYEGVPRRWRRVIEASG